jgi:hypothetical protein
VQVQENLAVIFGVWEIAEGRVDIQDGVEALGPTDSTHVPTNDFDL